MLKKEICKKCVSEKFQSGWTNVEEKEWANGIVLCSFALKTGALKITENCPPGCPYKNAN